MRVSTKWDNIESATFHGSPPPPRLISSYYTMRFLSCVRSETQRDLPCDHFKFILYRYDKHILRI